MYSMNDCGIKCLLLSSLTNRLVINLNVNYRLNSEHVLYTDLSLTILI